jgi:hypothetical protein
MTEKSVILSEPQRAEESSSGFFTSFRMTEKSVILSEHSESKNLLQDSSLRSE